MNKYIRKKKRKCGQDDYFFTNFTNFTNFTKFTAETVLEKEAGKWVWWWWWRGPRGGGSLGFSKFISIVLFFF